jgi:hypothetical protein
VIFSTIAAPACFSCAAIVRSEVEAQAIAAASADTTGLEAERIELRKQARNLSRAAAQLDGDIPPELLVELRTVNARATQVEKTLGSVSRAPVRQPRSSRKRSKVYKLSSTTCGLPRPVGPSKPAISTGRPCGPKVHANRRSSMGDRG